MKLVTILTTSIFISVFFISVTSAKPQKYAVLVATTRSWLFYRHQATVLHAYHTLLANGFDKNNIITMFYDDLVNNPKNPEKGVVRNHPFGDNLYPNMKKDYTGSKVNAENFLAILAGDSATAKGPVLKSGPKDSVFIYVVGLGATQLLTFPSGSPLTAQKFVAALKQLKSSKKAKQVLVFLETSFSASIVTGLLPRKGGIFVQSATHYNELPWAVYCNKTRNMCYGSLYGCAWTQRSDRLRQMKYGGKATLWDFYNSVRTLTTMSHASMYGHLEMAGGKLANFLDYKLVPRKRSEGAAGSSLLERLALRAINEAQAAAAAAAVAADDDDDGQAEADEGAQREGERELSGQPQLDTLYDLVGAEAEDGNSELDGWLANEPISDLDVAAAFAAESDDLSAVVEGRKFASDTLDEIVSEISRQRRVDASVDDHYHNLPPLTAQQSQVYEEAVREFNGRCFDMNANTYVQSVIGKLAVFAAQNVPLRDQVNAMKAVCSSHHRMASSIH